MGGVGEVSGVQVGGASPARAALKLGLDRVYVEFCLLGLLCPSPLLLPAEPDTLIIVLSETKMRNGLAQ